MMNRKDFLKTSAAVAVGTVLLPSCAMGGSGMKPGLQVYSVRDALKKDYEGTMKYIAEVGYKHIEGYGLGLYIVRHIITGHKGQITASSTPGKGSTFTVFLPLSGRKNEKNSNR